MHLKNAPLGLVLAALVFSQTVSAQLPAALTDKIQRGSGTIDILRDMAPEAFANYLRDTGELLLAVDLNENVSGLATADSIAVAIERMELTLRTTEGVFTFRDVWTSTAAPLLARGAAAPSEYFTLFGRAGSSQITTGDSALDSYDDVVRIRNVEFTGEILSALLNVSFLSTEDANRNSSESFFQFFRRLRRLRHPEPGAGGHPGVGGFRNCRRAVHGHVQRGRPARRGEHARDSASPAAGAADARRAPPLPVPSCGQGLNASSWPPWRPASSSCWPVPC